MSQTTFGNTYLKELEAEVTATRKCLERVPWKCSNSNRMKRQWKWATSRCL